LCPPASRLAWRSGASARCVLQSELRWSRSASFLSADHAFRSGLQGVPDRWKLPISPAPVTSRQKTAFSVPMEVTEKTRQSSDGSPAPAGGRCILASFAALRGGRLTTGQFFFCVAAESDLRLLSGGSPSPPPSRRRARVAKYTSIDSTVQVASRGHHER